MLRLPLRIVGRARAAGASLRWVSTLEEFASLPDASWTAANPHTVQNLVDGAWVPGDSTWTAPDPLNGEPFMHVSHVSKKGLAPFVNSLRRVRKSGLHNPIKNVKRYLMLGRVSDELSKALRTPVIRDYFTRLIMRTSPKSYKQAQGEVDICAVFLDNFSGDQVRFLARSFSVPGDRVGQTSNGYRWPYGPVALITPFNFPLEIPVLQLMGALYMGNKPVLKVDSKVSVVMEQFIRLAHACGLPAEDVDFLNCDGPAMNKLLLDAAPRMTLFTGSSAVAEKLSRELLGRIKIEDAGFDWKVLGPDVLSPDSSIMDYVAWTCDQDAYACSGQKCSAQSLLVAHGNWRRAGLFAKLEALAARRKLEDLTIGPVLTRTTESMLAHVQALLALPGAELLFGGKPLEGHSIPAVYGAIQPTAVYVPLDSILASKESYELATTEVFGPLQVVTTYENGFEEFKRVVQLLERMPHNLTAAVVSRDEVWRSKLLAVTVNGTTYAGIRARTTGAPQNHWFGPCGDPRGAGIGTPEAIKLVWSSHREIITDIAPVPLNWTTPEAT